MVYEEHKLAFANETYLSQISELKLKIETQGEEIEILKQRKEKHTSSPGCNYYTDVKRFERHLRMLDKRINVVSTSTEAIGEMRNYKWIEDRDGRILDKPVKDNDHFCDALRYATLGMLYNKSGSVSVGYANPNNK